MLQEIGAGWRRLLVVALLAWGGYRWGALYDDYRRWPAETLAVYFVQVVLGPAFIVLLAHWVYRGFRPLARPPLPRNPD